MSLHWNGFKISEQAMTMLTYEYKCQKKKSDLPSDKSGKVEVMWVCDDDEGSRRSFLERKRCSFASYGIHTLLIHAAFSPGQTE
jgi:hypothetical protein